MSDLTKFVRVAPAQGLIPRTKNWPVAASQTIKRGDLVKLSSGQIVQGLSLPGSNNSVTTGGNIVYLGVADADITTGSAVTADDQIPVSLFDDNAILQARIYDADAASEAEPQDLTAGTAYQIQRYRGASADEHFYVVSTTTTNGEAIYQGTADAAGEDYGIGKFKIKQADRAAG